MRLPVGLHPRSRRENKQLLVAAASQRGSSPLTRGKLSSGHDGSFQRGLIPAHAGKTDSCRPSCRIHRAHPRSRGENILTRKCASIWRGSSPLTRGKPSCGHVFVLARGLIPAHAGKTRCLRGRVEVARAHPRPRGENAMVTGAAFDPKGSSPLTRGKPNQDAELPHVERLIPAHAGKTQTRAATRSTRRAHPRSRGENRVTSTSVFCVPGSSPLTRGKHADPRGRQEV